MPSRPKKNPSYRLHKPSGQAVVRVDGRDHYLGKFGTDASHEAYRRLLARWLTARPATESRLDRNPGPTVDALIIAYWDRHLATYYVKDGRPTSEQDCAASTEVAQTGLGIK